MIETSETVKQPDVAGRTPMEFLAEVSAVLADGSAADLERAMQLLLSDRESGKRVYVIGNGGSAATATHLACDLTKSAQVDGLRPLRAFALADNASLVTAWANDVAYDQVFAGQLSALLDPGDLVIAISASGRSPNIVAGLSAAKAKGAHTIALLGFDGGAVRWRVDVAIHIPCNDYGVTEACHLAIGQAMVASLRQSLVHELESKRS
jgi:phosphoheptose isomerase